MAISNSYQVAHSDEQTYGSITVENQTVNAETSVNLVGKNVVDYAKPIAENFLHLLENFASGTKPTNAVVGQLWYDTNINAELPQLKQPQLKVFDGNDFVPSGNVTKSVSQPKIAALGDIWVNTVTQQLFICVGSNFEYSSDANAIWTLVGPQYSAGSLTGPKIDTLEDTSGQQRPVISLNVSGHTVAIISSVAFSPRSVIPGFETIKPGINISTVDNLQQNATDVNKLWGTAEKSNALVVGNSVVAAANFLRSDQNSTTNYSLSIKNNGGLKIGTGLTTSLNNTTNNETVLSNSVEGSSIYIKTNTGNALSNAITIQRNNVAIAKEIDTSKALDVGGNIGATGKLTISDVTAATSIDGSIRTLGGVSLAKNLIVGTTASIGGNLTTTSIAPAANEASNIGSPSYRYNSIYAKNVTADIFTGTFSGNFVSNTVIQGSVTSLNRTSGFSLSGDITSTTVGFNGTQDVVLSTSLGAGAISARTLALDSLPADELLINRPGSGLRKLTKQTFLASVPVIPIGTILPFAGNTPPPGYLLCDGSEQLTSRYPELFAVIGYTYKSLGTLLGVATFAVPDLRGRFALGRDNMNNGTTVPDKNNPTSNITTTFNKGGAPSISADRVTNPQADIAGGIGGNENIILETKHLPQHTHNLRPPDNSHQFTVYRYQPPDPNEVIVPEYETIGATATPNEPTTGRTMRNVGQVSKSDGSSSETDQPMDLMNPFLAINYIIFTGKIS